MKIANDYLVGIATVNFDNNYVYIHMQQGSHFILHLSSNYTFIQGGPIAKLCSALDVLQKLNYDLPKN